MEISRKVLVFSFKSKQRFSPQVIKHLLKALEGNVTLSDLDEGIKLGHNSVYNGSSDYDTVQYNLDMDKFKKMALETPEYATASSASMVIFKTLGRNGSSISHSCQIPVLDTGKFEQWLFWIQQYLQHEHYALWEVIEFDDSYKIPTTTDPNNTTTRKDDEKSGGTVTITTEDMQRKKNDVKERTTLLLSIPDEHQLRFSKYKTAKELWASILKTFGGNEATKKRKKNLLKQQYGNFKAEGSETLEQTFNRLQVIISQLQFIDVEVKKDGLNQKFLTSLAPEWLMHTIV
nr:ribonuclease H-like domain-containing protein [Tanacetum cinerariifolium]